MNQHELLNWDSICIRVIDATLFEIEETFDFKLAPIKLAPSDDSDRWPNLLTLQRSNVFFDPDGVMMYVEWGGSLYEWKLRAREEGPEWWLGEGYHA